MRTLIRVIQYGVAALLLHFCVTIYGQSRPKTEFFSSDVSDSFDEIYEKYIRVTADNCHIKVQILISRATDNLTPCTISACWRIVPAGGHRVPQAKHQGD